MASGRTDVFVVEYDRTVLKVKAKVRVDAPALEVLKDASRRLAIQQELERLGANAQGFLRKLDTIRVDVTTTSVPREAFSVESLVAVATLTLLVSAIFLAGQYVASGIAEERSSRVADILVSIVRPWQLLTGKILGNGLVGAVHLLGYAAAGIAAVALSGRVVSVDVPLGATLGWTVLWFILGYATFITLWAASATTAARPEDVNSVTTPIQLAVAAAWAIGIYLPLKDPTSLPTLIASFVPGVAPFAMLCRIIFVGAPLWQVITSVLISVLACVALTAWGGFMYQRGLRGMGV